jgi:hypothetical protein
MRNNLYPLFTQVGEELSINFILRYPYHTSRGKHCADVTGGKQIATKLYPSSTFTGRMTLVYPTELTNFY